MEPKSPKPNDVIYVQALYSYSYTDDAGVGVSMVAGETYRLLSKGKEWWQVSRLDSIASFYVPSTYVLVLMDDDEESEESEAETVERVESEEEVEGAGNVESHIPDTTTTTTKPNTLPLQHQLQHQLQQHQQQHSIVRPVSLRNEGLRNAGKSMDTYNNGEESLYQNYEPDVGSENGTGSFKVQHLKGRMLRVSSAPQDDYVNLANFRKESGLPSLDRGTNAAQLPPQPASPGSPDSQGDKPFKKLKESDYANLEELRVMMDPPLPDNAVLQKTLLGVWDMYLDPDSNRIFYVNKETHDRTWKPPRDRNMPGTFHYEKQRSHSSGEYEEPEDIDVGVMFTSNNVFQNRKSRSLDYGRPVLRPYFQSKSTPHGWRHFITEEGDDVYTNEFTNEKMKEKSPTTKANGDIPEQMSTSLQMISANPVPQQSEPVGVSSKGYKSDPLVTSYPMSQSIQLNEPIEGTLYKIKLEKGKKVSKKGSSTYVKLTGSNLVFYKDVKSSQAKQGSQHGKYEQMISLMTARVELNPGGYTRKNSILITTPEGHMLLYCDDFVKIQEWHIKLQNTIREVGGDGAIDSVESKEGPSNSLQTPEETISNLVKKPSFKKSHKRTPSEQACLEKDKGSLKSFLQNFLSTRQKIQQLEAKGIYKDAVFGSELKVLCEREKQRVPTFVQRAIVAIEKRGLDHEGLYRLSGNMATIQKLRCMVDQGDGYDLDDQSFDIHVLTGTLKLFFRELREPLFTFALFEKFIKAIQTNLNTDRLKLMKATVSDLPKIHYETIKTFFKHLLRVVEQSSINKMQAQNIAIVMGPTLIWPEEPSQNLATMMVYQGRIIEYLLLEYKTIFR